MTSPSPFSHQPDIVKFTAGREERVSISESEIFQRVNHRLRPLLHLFVVSPKTPQSGWRRDLLEEMAMALRQQVGPAKVQHRLIQDFNR